jgi:hypothetical protein
VIIAYIHNLITLLSKNRHKIPQKGNSFEHRSIKIILQTERPPVSGRAAPPASPGGRVVVTNGRRRYGEDGVFSHGGWGKGG